MPTCSRRRIDGLTVDGKLYAVPFYAESSFTLYRKDLFDAAGLTMPETADLRPDHEFASKLTDKSKEQYGICLRGKPGWGENMAFVGTLVNTFGGRGSTWTGSRSSTPTVEERQLDWYVDTDERGRSSRRHVPTASTRTRRCSQTGHCAMWIDATSAAGRVYDPKQSQVADKIAFAKLAGCGNAERLGWAWAWSLAIPATSKKADAAKSFLKWATSKDYVKLVGETEGWVAVPPGTRKSTYASPEYQKAAPFAATVLTRSSPPTRPSRR